MSSVPAMNPGKVVTRYQFSRLFNQAWMKGMTVSNVCAVFRVTGVHPLNRDVFSDVEDTPLVRESGLAFIYSPATRRTKPRASEQCLESSSPHLDDSSTYHLGDDTSKLPDTSCVWLQAPQSSAVSRFLRCPSPVNRQTTYRPKSCGRVLTSAESLSKIASEQSRKRRRRRWNE